MDSVDLVLARPGAASRAEAHWDANLPLGIGYLASSSISAGYKTAVVDGRASHHDSVERTTTAILRYRPKVVGLSALTVEIGRSAEIAKEVKRASPSTITVLGGAHANVLPGESLLAYPDFDYVIAGEAEYSLVGFLRALRSGVDPLGIAGVHGRGAKGAPSCLLPAAYSADMSKVPFPAWDLFPPSTVYPMMTERGCPYECVFCSRNMSRRVRSRPIEHVIEEIRWLDQKFCAKEIHIEDETFGLHHETTDELLEFLSEYNHDGHLRFKAQTRADQMTPELAQKLRKAGFHYIEIGVESGDQAILSRARKGIDLTEITRSIQALKNEGIKTWVNFIIGLPGETKESVRHSIDLAVNLNPHRLSVAIIVAYPGSKVYEWAKSGSHGYRLLTNKWDRFDKYLSRSVELDTLNYSEMRWLQMRMYLETYLRNIRIKDLLVLLWKNRSFALPVVGSLLPRSPTSSA